MSPVAFIAIIAGFWIVLCGSIYLESWLRRRFPETAPLGMAIVAICLLLLCFPAGYYLVGKGRLNVFQWLPMFGLVLLALYYVLIPARQPSVYRQSQFERPPSLFGAILFMMLGAMTIATELPKLNDSTVFEGGWGRVTLLAFLGCVILLTALYLVWRCHQKLRCGQQYESPVVFFWLLGLLGGFLDREEQQTVVLLPLAVALSVHGLILLRHVAWDSSGRSGHYVARASSP